MCVSDTDHLTTLIFNFGSRITRVLVYCAIVIFYLVSFRLSLSLLQLTLHLLQSTISCTFSSLEYATPMRLGANFGQFAEFVRSKNKYRISDLCVWRRSHHDIDFIWLWVTRICYTDHIMTLTLSDYEWPVYATQITSWHASQYKA